MWLHEINLMLLFWRTRDFSGGSDSKASVYNAGDPGLIPGSGLALIFKYFPTFNLHQHFYLCKHFSLTAMKQVLINQEDMLLCCITMGKKDDRNLYWSNVVCLIKILSFSLALKIMFSELKQNLTNFVQLWLLILFW